MLTCRGPVQKRKAKSPKQGATSKSAKKPPPVRPRICGCHGYGCAASGHGTFIPNFLHFTYECVDMLVLQRKAAASPTPAVARFQPMTAAASKQLNERQVLHTAPEVVAIGMFLWINRVRFLCRSWTR